MERLDGSVVIDSAYRGGIIALGNFDGFHLGHQSVVRRAMEVARADGRPVLVGTFDPHPASYFNPASAPFQLTTIDQRIRLFEDFGVDAAILFRFDEVLAAVGAEEFVTDWLIGRLGVAGVVTGQDFTFGKARSGNADVLSKLGAIHNITTQAVPPLSDDEGVISSTRIRAALTAGDMDTATRLLSRPYAIEGVVSHGDKVGRQIGFPTANVVLADYVRPAYGIYAVRCRLEDGRVLNGAANIGVRPMFDPPKELLEVHLFDFAGDLYGQTIHVELRHYLRPEARFDGLDELIAQMQRDCAKAKELLAA